MILALTARSGSSKIGGHDPDRFGTSYSGGCPESSISCLCGPPAQAEGGPGRKASPCLTLQPIGPKLRPTKHMPRKAPRVRLVALLLGIIFLGAQFHFCADLAASPSTHFCPVCSMASSAVAPQSPGVAILPATNRLEVVSLVLAVSLAFPRAVCPRAPPAR